MKTETKEKIIADYIRERNRKAGLALKKQKPKNYYAEIGKKGAAARIKKLKLKTVDNSKLDSVAG